MLNTTVIIKRLALIKYLYKVGLEQSRQFETVAAFSILTFHDSIEMFLKLVSEHLNIRSESASFLDYWTLIPNLSLKESMRHLNARRVNIKHKGLLPSKSDIEISRVNTIDFFDQNVKIQFGIDFNAISLIDLVNYENVRNVLMESQKFIDQDEYKPCIEKVAIAFNELLFTYEQTKIYFFRNSPFSFSQDLSFYNSFFMHIEDKKLGDFVDKVKDSLEGIQKAIKIICLGIDYKKYAKFNLLTPEIHRWHEGGIDVDFDNRRVKKWTKDNCQFCIDFVLDSALKLQEFDFNIEEIEEPISFPKKSK